MFVIEIVAGITGGSKALQADALDFFGDTANYAISLGVAGMTIAWRARAAMLKGATLALLGVYVLFAAGWGALHDATPHAEIMGVVGIAALIANLVVAIMLYRFRSGMRICDRCGFARATTRSATSPSCWPQAGCSALTARGLILPSPP